MDDSGIRHEIGADGVLRVVFDLPESRVNLLTAENLAELDRLLEETRHRAEVRAVLFSSPKPGMFLAGMDVDRIARITDARDAAEGSRRGQDVFRKLAGLGRPSACAIGGVCLGGGTELALACTFRLAADHPTARIGLPEVRIGMIPGFGGTQRLPRLIGMAAALDLILSGRPVDARRARSLGLVDRIVPPEYLEREAVALLRRAVEEDPDRVASSLRSRSARLRALAERIGPLRRMVADRARRRTAGQVSPEAYPAPFRAIEAVEAAFSGSLDDGLDVEARLVGELIPTDTSKNLIRLFRDRTVLKGDLGGVRASPRPVRRLAVLGCGTTGAGIAWLAADRELPVRLLDPRLDAILEALRGAQALWDERRRAGRLSDHALESRRASIAPALAPSSGLQSAEFLLEDVADELGAKQDALAAAEACLPQQAVVASASFSLPIGDIAARALRPERVVGLRLFPPTHRVPLAEIVAGRRSAPEAVATTHALVVRLGKVPVVVRDGPGILVHRVLFPYLEEAARLLAEGVRVEAVDRAARDFGMPVGPLELLDDTGIDVLRRVGSSLRAAFGDRIGDGGGVLERMASEGRLGRRSGGGFYRYRRGRRAGPDPGLGGLLGSPAIREVPSETLQERLVLAMVNEAARCVEDGAVRGPRDADVASVLGAGFPPFRGGPLRHADTVGIPIIVDRLGRLADAHGERFRPSAGLHDMVRSQRRFYGER